MIHTEHEMIAMTLKNWNELYGENRNDEFKICIIPSDLSMETILKGKREEGV